MHKIKACVLSCIDYRIQTTLYSWLNEHVYLGTSDIISIAGSLRDISYPQNLGSKENLFRQLKISSELHSPDILLIFEHQDCGGYAIDGTISSGNTVEKDLEKHKESAVIAERELSNLLPDIKKRFLFITLDGRVLDLL